MRRQLPYALLRLPYTALDRANPIRAPLLRQLALKGLKRHNFSLITPEKNTMINAAPVADKAEQKIVAQARLLKKAGVAAPILQYTCSMVRRERCPCSP